MVTKKQRLLGIAIIVLSVVLAIIGYIILPDTLVMQVSTNGTPGNQMHKLLGLCIPLALSTVFAVLYLRGAEKDRMKNLIVAVVGLALWIVLFIMNK